MASLKPVSDHVEVVRHSCGELNPIEASFCGGCGTNLGQGVPCPSCEHVGTPGARFCQQCGGRLRPTNAAAEPELESRVAAVEAEIVMNREDLQPLLQLKEQLDAALKRTRQKQGGSGAATSRPTGAKSASARPASTEPTEPERNGDDESGTEAARVVETVPSPAEMIERGEPKPTHITVVHLEDRPELQHAMQTIVEQYSTASYHSESALAEGLPDGRPLVVANLLGNSDPLEVATGPELRARDAKVFTYATEGTRGFVIGMTELFPPPFEPEACAARLLTLLPAAPRVLVVSGADGGTPELRAHLTRQGCTTSIAFDERQAAGLIPSVRPNLVLIDLNLPRGEGLRLAGRLRADPLNAGMRLAFLWQEPIDPALFRQYATRSIHDFQFKADELGRALMQEFNPGGAAYIDPR